MGKEVVIVSAARTAIGAFQGSLKDVPAVQLGAIVMKAAVERANISSDLVDEVIMGNVLSAGLGQNPARQASIQAGFSQEIPAITINHVCGSGLKAVHLAAQAIASGEAEVVVAGGFENMSQAPYILKNARDGFRMGHQQVQDTMIQDGLWCAFNDYHMGVTAEKLAVLRPAFKKDGSVTAGNASGINDGAAAVVVMSKERAVELGITPLATIVANASAGVDPSIMGIGPVKAVTKALEKANVTMDQLDLIEANEAFAAQAIAVDRELNFNHDKLNVNGGAIALGHPIGASGARVLVTLLYEMQRQNALLGLATLCIGGGQGVATIVRR